MRSRVMLLSSVAAGLVATLITASLIALPSEDSEPTARVGVLTALTSTPADPFTADPTAAAPAVAAPAVAEPVPPSPEEQEALADAVSRAVNDVVAGTEIGLAVYDQHTGTMLVSVNPDEQFHTASVVKLLIALRVLRDAGWEVPSGAEGRDLALMLSHSADWVAGSLWEIYGGPAITEELAAIIELDHISPPKNPGQWELTRMSPRDVVSVYRYIANDIPEEASQFVLTALADAPEVAPGGFDQSFGIPDTLPDTEWSVKQGWMRVVNGLVLNTTGIVGPEQRYVVALLTRQPDGTSFEAGRAAVTAGIAALAPTLTSDRGPRVVRTTRRPSHG